MFSDTHCHLSHIEERGEDLSRLIAEMDARRFPFVLDIGTKPADFEGRLNKVRNAADLPSFLHFTCGLWPDGDVIADRHNALSALEEDLRKMIALCLSRGEGERFAALGECGLDRYWNGSRAAERAAERAALESEEACGAGKGGGAGKASGVSDDGPGTTDTNGEEELFGLQLDVARSRKLPVIVHSRDAFVPTLGCIKNSGWDRGVIHCYSYGIPEARAFLDRGWYISFPGNITWAKKETDRERIASLVRYIPRDRLLLETDAPYMAPAPHRGKTNTPLFIEHTYECAAAVLSMTKEALALLVSENAKDLFVYPGPH